MLKTMRALLLLICAVQLFFAAAFFFQWPLAVTIWPFEGTTPLTYIFIGSIFAAAAASTLWPIVTGNDGALAGIAPEFRTGLIVYTIVVTYSGLLAIFYLFVNKQTRLFG